MRGNTAEPGGKERRGLIVAKFGGSSLADAGQFRKVRDIVRADTRRRVVVPSAPGKRFDGDEKVTDLLYRCHREHEQGVSFRHTFSIIRSRYNEIARELLLAPGFDEQLDRIEEAIANGASEAYCASRGEYLSGLLLAEYLRFPFVDAAESVLFDENGTFDPEKTHLALLERLTQMPGAVLPGFYGGDEKGGIHVFPRGGSDITGALAARAVRAELYENWTDVSGFLMADPKIVPHPRIIRHITYQEMHALSRAGASVLHEDSVSPVSLAGIPTNIRNTDQPEDQGTMITSTALYRSDFSIFAGIAGRKGFSLVVVEKEAGERAPGIRGASVFQAAQQFGLSAQPLPSSEDTVCLVVDSAQYEKVQVAFEEAVLHLESPCTISVRSELASIVLVGYGILHNRNTVNRVFSALNRNGIAVRMLNQGSGELSTWVSVDEKQMEDAIRCLYREFSE